MAEQAQQQFAIQRLYIKDVSFEAPLGAQVFTKQWNPEINVDLNTSNSQVADNLYEASLRITITGKLEGENAFLIEADQAGLFVIEGLNDQQRAQALGIMAPNILFPYVREAIDNLAIKGGFPAIGIQPINFEALFMQQQQAQQNA